MLEQELVPGSSAYKHLVRLAKNGSTTEYVALANVLGVDLSNPKERTHLSGTLEMISRYETEHGRPMLSAIVLAHNKPIPNKGFFELARELGLFHHDNERAFHEETIASVFGHWRQW